VGGEPERVTVENGVSIKASRLLLWRLQRRKSLLGSSPTDPWRSLELPVLYGFLNPWSVWDPWELGFGASPRDTLLRESFFRVCPRLSLYSCLRVIILGSRFEE
jgi:hypothetical protein